MIGDMLRAGEAEAAHIGCCRQPVSQYHRCRRLYAGHCARPGDIAMVKWHDVLAMRHYGTSLMITTPLVMADALSRRGDKGNESRRGVVAGVARGIFAR